MEKVLTFYLCDGLFGIDITLVKEINRNVEFTPVPGSSPNIEGLLNLRGQIVTLFNLARVMGYKEKKWGQKSTSVILKADSNDSNHIGFLIDKAGDVVDIDKNECEAPPANVGVIEGEFLHSVVKLKDELLMIIDPTRIFMN